MTAVEEERRGAQDVEFFAEDRRAVFAILMMRGAVLALVFSPMWPSEACPPPDWLPLGRPLRLRGGIGDSGRG